MTTRHPTTGYEPEREPTPVGGISTEQVRGLARAEAEAEGRRQQQECVERGPVCALWQEIGTMRTDIGALKIAQAEASGAMKAQARNVTIIVAVIGALGLAAQLANRLWPVQAPHVRPVAAEVAK